MSCHVPVAEPPILLPEVTPTKGPVRTVVLVGPPNAGKSTLFNRLTGLRQKVANYPGVTVEHHSGKMKGIGRGDLTVIDLPGIYSLATYSEDARVAVDVLTGRMPGVPQPDVVLLILDAVHMNRQLMLAQTVFSIGLPTMVLLNMSDLLEDRGGKIDPLALSHELGHPVALISSAKGTGNRSDCKLFEPVWQRCAGAAAATAAAGAAEPGGFAEVGDAGGGPGELSRSQCANMDAPAG